MSAFERRLCVCMSRCCPSVCVCRRGIALAHLNGPVYAVGGLDDTACFNIVERYDADADQWTTVQSMNSARGGVAVTAFRVRTPPDQTCNWVIGSMGHLLRSGHRVIILTQFQPWTRPVVAYHHKFHQQNKQQPYIVCWHVRFRWHQSLTWCLF